ncbi:MAG: ATP-binding cassette domain-containing protein, partial [Spirochaetaceae bacterium]|nr:ATP-binding cassette domain-containing protein [Spirochaetaceae bacterium]
MLKISHISKHFTDTGIDACRDVELTAESGMILAIVGENGAGKSTLMNILCGIVPLDRGAFSIDGRTVKPGNPEESSQAGIGMIHQHPAGAGSLKVIENIILGYEPLKYGIFTDLKKAEQDIIAIQRKFGLPLALNKLCSDLNSAQIQRMELLHLLYTGKSILIFDEPTASLSDHQISKLMETIFRLKKENKIILFISHKLNEVFQTADSIAVMRKGKVILQKSSQELTPELVALKMIGKSGEINYPYRNNIPSRKMNLLYSIKNLSYRKSDSEYLENIDLHIHRGEILGIAGIRENGLELLEDIISGMRHPHKGQLTFNGADVSTEGPSKLRARGISYVPADRLKRGASTDSTIAENLILLNYKRMHKMGILAPASINKWAETIQYADRIDGEPDQQVKHLSGGNIQKVILSRELRENPDLIIICEPSWGLDFSSRNRLHEELNLTALKGTSILLISSDIDEILALSDQIAVLYEGEITICDRKEKMNRTIIGEYMLG